MDHITGLDDDILKAAGFRRQQERDDIIDAAGVLEKKRAKAAKKKKKAAEKDLARQMDKMTLRSKCKQCNAPKHAGKSCQQAEEDEQTK